MPEYITKEQAWEVVKIVARHGGVDSIINADKRLAAMPPADVVEVVRCKGCRFRRKRESTAIGTYYVCILDGSQMPDPDYFCAHGENCRENQNAKTHGCNMSSSPDAFLCSECGRTLEDPFEGIYVDGVFIGSRQISPNYCPYCGARMDGEQ